MRLASDQPSSKPQRASIRQRAAAFVVAVAVQVLLIVMLLGLAPSPMRLFRTEPKTFQLLPDPRTPAARGKSPVKVKRASGGAPRRAPTPPAKATAPVPAPPLALIPLTRSEFAASDIAALPSHHSESGPGNGGSGTGTGRDSGAADGGGEGTGGDQLYNAEWYRRPTHAELAYYLPKNMPASGWGMIACRTIANYQVDDCKELGDSPMGSGLARAVRQAAWQFRVWPPRLNGKPLVGSWVRIRIEYTEGVGEAR